jgi:DNA-binding CsgD family transcriptional regulator
MLTIWGVSPDADLVFRFLAQHGPRTTESLRRELDLSRHRTVTALDELVDIDAVDPNGRLGRPGADPGRWQPRPPELVVAALRERRRRAAQASLAMRRRFLDLDCDLGADPDTAMTARPLYGLTRTRARLVELSEATRLEHLSMHPEPAFDRSSVQASAPLDDDLVVRGVDVRSLGVPPAVEDVTAAHALALTRRGVQYREFAELPAKMILFDRRIAVVPLDPAAPGKGALEITAVETVDRLARWFEHRWDDAGATTPPTTAVRLTSRERRIVALLAAGHTDASAAARLGLSERTVAYAVSDAMERFRVQNRFQLGLVLGADLPRTT